MEVSLIGISKSNFVKTEIDTQKIGFLKSKQISRKKNRITFAPAQKFETGPIRVVLKNIRSEISQSEKVIIRKRTNDNLAERLRLFVGLPVDAVTSTGSVNHVRALSAGLRALKLLGVEGVELPIWWGIVEKESMGKYNWSGYLELAEMVKTSGLKLRVSLCFHASKSPSIPLPDWVSRIGTNQPDIYFTDRSGRRFKDCLSFAVDELPVLDGKTPMEVFKAFLESFKTEFSDFLGSTTTDITVSLGPDGELRYPSTSNRRLATGAGEFQCYDKHMLAQLKQHAITCNHENWGFSGPHDAPTYDQSPMHSGFFKDSGGSWDTPYGQFFLSWYSSVLISHGQRLLSLAGKTFSDFPVTISGIVPILNSPHKIRSHPVELTSGYYNTDHRDGYDAIAQMFAGNSAGVVFPGMNMSNPSTNPLLCKIKSSFVHHGVKIYGETASVSKDSAGFDELKKNVSDSMDLLTYQRMGAYFFSPEHWPYFTEFVRSMDREEVDRDDLPAVDSGSLSLSSATSLSSDKKEMQTA